MEAGDGRETDVITITEPDGTVVVQAHPLVKKRALAASTPVASVVQTPAASGAGGSTTTTTVASLSTGWQPEAYIKAANAEQYDLFGFSTALSGDTLAVGAIYEDSNQTTITNGSSLNIPNDWNNNGCGSGSGFCESGAVYVYRRTGNQWAQEAYIKAANAEQYDQFGFSTALSGDTLAVGTPYEDSNQTTITNGSSLNIPNDWNNNGCGSGSGSCESGTVYVYRRTGNQWAQEAYIKAANAEQGDQFGTSVALSGDTLAVGTPSEDSNQTTITNASTLSIASDSNYYNGCGSGSGSCQSGAVYVYRRIGNQWAQEAYIKAANADAYDHFGSSVALSGDTLAVGTPNEDSTQTTITNASTLSIASDTNYYNGCGSVSGSCDSGAVYVYRRTGNQWAQEAYIKAANADAYDNFGSSVAISGDTLVVGTPNEDSTQTTITNASTLSIASDSNYNNGCGSVSGSCDSGAVYVYRRSGSQWAQEAYIKAANADQGDYFGNRVSISGETLAVGAPFEDSGQNSVTNTSTLSREDEIGSVNSGAVFVYKRNSGGWILEALLKAANVDANDYFGRSVSVSGDTVVVGTPEEWSKQRTISNGASASPDNSGQGYGAVYVYRNTSRIFDPDVRVESAAADSITFRWHANLGNTSQVKVAPVAIGKSSAAQNCDGGIILSAGITSYTYSGLSAGSRYGFRFCGWDGSIASGGMPLWAETSAQDFSQGTDGWIILNNQSASQDRNKTYMNGSADKMLGPIGKLESISKTFALDGTPAVITFDLLVLESWDNESFTVYGTNAAGQKVVILSELFFHGTATKTKSGSLNGFAWSIATSANNSFHYLHSEYFPGLLHYSHRFNISIATPSGLSNVTLEMTSGLGEAITNEAWGIDNFRLSR